MQQLPNIFISNNKMYANTEFLKPWDKNPRSITEENFERLKKDLQSEQFKPLLILDDGTVLGGNMRIRAYKEIGLDKVWVSVISLKKTGDGLVQALVNGVKDKVFQTELDAMLHYSTRDNSPYGAYDKQQTVELFNASELPLDDYLVPFGEAMSIEEAMKEFGPEDEVVEDEAPEVDSTVVISKQGEVYQLGKHRLMCGDSTKIEDVEKLMNGQKADMVFTDPPYGVSFQSNMRTKTDKFNVLDNDDRILTEWIPFLDVFSTGFIFIWTTWKVLEKWNEAVKPLGSLTNLIVWYKGGGGIGDLTHTFATDYEMAMVFGRGKDIVGKRVGSVWEIHKDFAGSYDHPTQKPVGLAALALNSTTEKNNMVLDLFGGSGSTLIACEQLNRTCYMMELDPKYCDVIRKRYAKFIDKEDSWQEITPCVKHEEKTTSLS